MTPRGAALTGTWLWSCMRKGYSNMFCTFLWSWIQFAAQICRIWTIYWEISVKCYMNTLMLLILNLQCGVINKQQYVRWRERGLAFEMREGVYQITNPSLLSSRVFSLVRACLLSVMINNASIQSYWRCVCVCVWTERGESGSDGLLGRYSVQSLPLFRHWIWWQDSAEDTERATHEGKAVPPLPVHLNHHFLSCGKMCLHWLPPFTSTDSSGCLLCKCAGFVPVLVQ